MAVPAAERLFHLYYSCVCKVLPSRTVLGVNAVVNLEIKLFTVHGDEFATSFAHKNSLNPV